MISERRDGRCAGLRSPSISSVTASPLLPMAHSAHRSASHLCHHLSTGYCSPMPESKARRPAHRPSRRFQLIEAAVELFAVKPVDLVTIAEIVRQAGMTPAAFYYHFPSREDLLQEFVTQFAEDWTHQAERLWGDARSADDVLAVVQRLLDWANEHRMKASVYFVNSRGASVAVEEIRQNATSRTSAAAAAAICRATGREPGASTSLEGLSLVTVIESALRAELSLDAAYRTLGPQHFRDEVHEQCARVINVLYRVA
ncbi:TetR/AcrR family transcriptional regulator [Prauserella endophytica]|uniref:TetR/AcrR family transcriptional regulator n=2 Tax=Prauserella endophytica TaxID=1592324 RepID=A0ABY2S4Z8_9PSEU|nr:TetR/AcrR family transcriptional regulator [Prauserella endophytica]